MPRGRRAPIDEKSLTKGQLRKLNALRKSLGETIADRAFSQWLARQPGSPTAAPDKNAEMIADALRGLTKKGDFKIPRGGYVVRRGRGRVIVERAKLS